MDQQHQTSVLPYDLGHLEQYTQQQQNLEFDLLTDPRWENIYIPDLAVQQQDFHNWMHYRQQEDALSSAGSSSDGSYYQASIYSASSDQQLRNDLMASYSSSFGNPYGYSAQQQQVGSATLPPRSTAADDDPHAGHNWFLSASPMSDPGGTGPGSAHNSTHSFHDPYGGGGGPGSQRDSGEFDYSSADEQQQMHPSLHYSHHHQQQQPSPASMYFSTVDSAPYSTPQQQQQQQQVKADLYATPPPSANAQYPSPYPSPNAQQQQHRSDSRLTPVFESLSIDQQQRAQQQQQQQSQQAANALRYPQSPLSPNGYAGSAPGPSRTSHRSHTGSADPYQRSSSHSRHYGPGPPSSSVGGSASVTAGAGAGTGAGVRGHQHNASISTAASGSSASSAHSHSHSHYAPSSSSPNANSMNGKIFGNNGAPSSSSNGFSQPVHLPPLTSLNPLPSPPSSSSNSNGNGTAPPSHPNLANIVQSSKRPKQMMPGTPTHPDIPRPAVVEPPVPVPNLTKKSRGRQVPSVVSVHGAGAGAPASVGRSSTGSRNSFGNEGLESPLSPNYQQVQGGYFSDESSGVENNGSSRGSNHGATSVRDPGPSSSSNVTNGASAAGSSHTHRSIFGPGGGSLAGALVPPPSGSSGLMNGTGVFGASSATPSGASLEAELRSRPFVCNVEGCGKAYIRAEHLKRHVRSIHTNDKPYECPHPGCGREFSRYDNLCQHFKGVHGPTSSMPRTSLSPSA